MRYRHTQTAPAMLWLSAIGLVVAVGVGLTRPFDPTSNVIIEIACAIIVVTGVVGSRLTVTVDERAVSATFGWRWPRRTIELSAIAAANQVTNSWWHGWGLRKISHGWMYNNAGREAIELHLVSGRRFRIGTDEPDTLLGAIRAAIGQTTNER